MWLMCLMFAPNYVNHDKHATTPKPCAWHNTLTTQRQMFNGAHPGCSVSGTGDMTASSPTDRKQTKHICSTIRNEMRCFTAMA